MLNIKNKLLIPALLMGLSAPVFAEIDTTVVAVINGQNIIAEELKMTAQQNKVAYDSLNINQKKLLLNGLINRQLVALAAKEKKYEQSPEMKLKLTALIDSVLAATYLEDMTHDVEVTEQELKDLYETNVKENSQTQYKARHILVKDETTANAILKQISEGGDFAAIAKEKSEDKGSAKNGGDLGWFNPRTMVPEFAKAVQAAKIGEKPTQAVKSDFGYHLILVEDTKAIEPPSYDSSKEKLKSMIIKSKLSKYLEELNSKAKVEIKLQ